MRSFIDMDFSVSLQSLVGRPWGGFPQYSEIISNGIRASSALPYQSGIFKSYAKYYANYVRDNSYSYPYTTPDLVTIQNGQVSADFSTSSIPYASGGDESVTIYSESSTIETRFGLRGSHANLPLSFAVGFDYAFYSETPPSIYIFVNFIVEITAIVDSYTVDGDGYWHASGGLDFQISEESTDIRAAPVIVQQMSRVSLGDFRSYPMVFKDTKTEYYSGTIKVATDQVNDYERSQFSKLNPPQDQSYDFSLGGYSDGDEIPLTTDHKMICKFMTEAEATTFFQGLPLSDENIYNYIDGYISNTGFGTPRESLIGTMKVYGVIAKFYEEPLDSIYPCNFSIPTTPDIPMTGGTGSFTASFDESLDLTINITNVSPEWNVAASFGADMEGSANNAIYDAIYDNPGNEEGGTGTGTTYYDYWLIMYGGDPPQVNFIEYGTQNALNQASTSFTNYRS